MAKTDGPITAETRTTPDIALQVASADIWAQKYRLTRKDGSAVDDSVDATWQRVARALAEVHLPTAPEFLRRLPHQLNQGALQRLCLARALITEPLLVVADEPTSALDPSVQAKIMKLLLDLQIEKGLTLLLVTHDLGLARKVSDRIGVMHAGRLVEVGNAAQVLRRPGHPYTRELLNASFELGDTDELHL
jgi:peptide/nickel transport system ATP-binding protein